MKPLSVAGLVFAHLPRIQLFCEEIVAILLQELKHLVELHIAKQKGAAQDTNETTALLTWLTFIVFTKGSRRVAEDICPRSNDVTSFWRMEMSDDLMGQG